MLRLPSDFRIDISAQADAAIGLVYLNKTCLKLEYGAFYFHCVVVTDDNRIVLILLST